jgi:DNA polymerase-3 subunit gamma/tau
MSESLYRKYRPQSFTDVVGQERSVAVMQSFISSNQVPASIILKGTRGVGKTTMARIFARELGVDPIDIYELDAASNNGVEDMRELCNEALGMPIMSARKIYIFDEVHMFSNSTWNALLKTLEEPPSHVVFIMATTDDHKIPETVVSRSVVVGLQSPNDESLRIVLSRTAQSEGYVLSDDALGQLVVAADGSFRNAQVALETVMTVIPGKDISADDVSNILSLPPLVLVRDIVRAIAYPSEQALVSVIERVSGYDAVQCMRTVLSRVHMCLGVRFQIVKSVPEADRELVTTIARDITGARINAAVLAQLLRIESDMLVSADPGMTLQAYLYSLIEGTK